MGKRFKNFIDRLRRDAERFNHNTHHLEEMISRMKQRQPWKSLSLATKRLEQNRYLHIRCSAMEDELKKHVSPERYQELLDYVHFKDNLWHGRPPSPKRRERGPAKEKQEATNAKEENRV